MNEGRISIQTGVLVEFAGKIDVVATGALESGTIPLRRHFKDFYAIIVGNEDEITRIR